MYIKANTSKQYMIEIYPIKQITNNLCKIKRDLSLKQKYMNKFSLQYIGYRKKEYMNDIQIIHTTKETQFIRCINTNISIQDNYLMYHKHCKNIPSYNYNTVDYSEIFHLYQTNNNNIVINMEEYSTYFIIYYSFNDIYLTYFLNNKHKFLI